MEVQSYDIKIAMARTGVEVNDEQAEKIMNIIDTGSVINDVEEADFYCDDDDYDQQEEVNLMIDLIIEQFGIYEDQIKEVL